MASFAGFSDPNYTQAPNDLFDVLLPQINSLAELKVLMVAIRQMLGWQKETDAISISQFERATGLSREIVVKGIQACLQRGTLQRISQGPRGLYTYRLNMLVSLVGKADQSEKPTSQDNRPELVGKADYSLVGKADPQKKGKKTITKEKTSTVVEVELTAAQRLYRETFPGRLKTLQQKEALAKAEMEFGFDLLKRAIDWAAVKPLSDIHAIIGAARTMAKGDNQEARRNGQHGAQSSRPQELSREEVARSLDDPRLAGI